MVFHHQQFTGKDDIWRFRKYRTMGTDMLRHLISTQGCIQNFPLDHEVPDIVRNRFVYLQKKYKTAFKHSQRVFADMYLARAKYQCQSTSNNTFMKSPTLTSLNSYHFYMWKVERRRGQRLSHWGNTIYDKCQRASLSISQWILLPRVIARKQLIIVKRVTKLNV